MRRIRKTHPPASFRKWFEDNKHGNCDYLSGLCGTQAHKDLKQFLLKEQGYLCGYTGRRIAIETSHIEHLKPQTRCLNNEDVDYRNMVACFPKSGGDMSVGYGATIKADWWDKDFFVSPCSRDCETRFKYMWSGKMYARDDGDAAANLTIQRLKLDHDSLIKMRRKAIKAFFFGIGTRKHTELKRDEAILLLKRIDQPDKSGQLKEFCFALKHLLPKYVAPGSKS